MKNLLICIDGTGNEPSDADPEIDIEGEEKDENISNVLKLHILAGGRLNNSEGVITNQSSYYFSGVGTRGSKLRETFNAMFAADADNILKDAYKTASEAYEDGDQLSIFGFSRGAAIARQLAASIDSWGLGADEKSHQNGKKVPIQFLGVWDTVAAFDLELDTKTRSTGVLEEKGSIGESIQEARHAVSIDDIRKAFTPTLMNRDKRVTEVWFAGVHSDIGGGYAEDALSDVALEFMLAGARHAGIKFLPAASVEQILGQNGKDPVAIKPETLELHPDPLADSHIGNFGGRWDSKLASKTVALRDVVVIRNDEKSPDEVPIIHESVIKRILKTGYRPKNLAKHRVFGAEPPVVFAKVEEHLAPA